MPVDEIRAYFGEDLGLYFSFLEIYTKMLFWPGMFGLITFITQLASGEVSPDRNPLTLPFALFICLWVSMFTALWARNEAMLKFRCAIPDDLRIDRP
eukprot:COSAG05_NODE_1309_length_5222_cov_9.690611_9_plen_97_part_00